MNINLGLAMASSSHKDPRWTLIQASHILHVHNVLDSFGHISMRNPANDATFFQSNHPAGVISSPKDITEYWISNGKPVDPNIHTSTYSEHYIHAALFARFSEVNSVVHSHARAVLPFSVSTQPLRPILHTAGFLGAEGPPVWDSCSADGDATRAQNLVVSSYAVAESLASAAEAQDSHAGYHSVVLQRGHGFVALGRCVEQAVYNAVYTVENAVVLREALQLNDEEDLAFLSPEEVRDCAAMNADSVVKVWPLWTKECEKSPMFN